MTTVKVFDHEMKFISEIDVDISGNRMSLDIKSPHCTEENLTGGNIISIDGREYIEWFPREWDDNSVTMRLVEKK